MDIGTSTKVSPEPGIGGSTLRGPVLGLLLQQDTPIGAYRLASLLMQRLPAWQVSHSAVANLLKRLVGEGYVSCIPGPTKAYCATDRAQLALEQWMARPLHRESIREELHARIASSSPHHAPLLEKALESYERESFALLTQGPPAEASAGSWRSLTINLTRAAADETLHANVKWSKVAREWIREWTADHDTKTVRHDDPAAP